MQPVPGSRLTMQPEAFAIQLNAYAGQDVGMAWRLLRVMTSRVFGAEGTPRSGKTGQGVAPGQTVSRSENIVRF